MDYYFWDPHKKRIFTNKMVDLYWKWKAGHTKTGLSADQWGIRMAMYQEKAQRDGEVLQVSRRGSNACTINAYTYLLHLCCLCLLISLCLVISTYVCHLLMHICSCLWSLVIAYAAYACLCSFIYLLMGHDISKGIFCWTTKYGRKGSI
jgi:hypothetical protein